MTKTKTEKDPTSAKSAESVESAKPIKSAKSAESAKSQKVSGATCISHFFKKTKLRKNYIFSKGPDRQ